jgi:hypothetical protein
MKENELEINSKLDEIYNFILSKKEKFVFNLKNLPEINDYKTDILKDLHFKDIFISLNTKLNNCIYWFELQDENKCQQLVNRLKDNMGYLATIQRVVPPINKNNSSKILYLGIRRGRVRKRDNLTSISGRMVHHLGYYIKGSTQGLQLAHWAKNYDEKITLNIVELKNLPNEYLNVCEKILSYHMKPMCGRH